MKITPSDINSGEHLVNFINNASTSVKTVLSKPGCFKRNTNHRRFLQKQLRQNAQDNINAIIRNKAQTTTTTTKDTLNTKKNTTCQPPSPKLNINNSIVKKVSATKREKTIRKKRRYNPIRLSTLPALQQLQPPSTTPSSVPLLIPSPMAEFVVHDTQYNNREMAMMDSLYQTPSQSYATRQNFFPSFANHYTGNQPQLPPPMYEQTDFTTATTSHHFEQNFLTMPNITRRDSSSSSSTSSYTSDEDFGFSDFLSGEDLMRNLEFGDLFIPEQKGNNSFTNSEEETFQNELAYRAYLETERQMQYLAHLEAIEACYQAREIDLFEDNNNSSFFL